MGIVPEKCPVDSMGLEITYRGTDWLDLVE